MRSLRRKVLQRVFLVLASPIVFLALLDFFVVLWGFEYPPDDAPIVLQSDNSWIEGRHLHEPALRQIWRPIPGAPIPWGENEHINAGGYRGPLLALEKTPGVLRIATLGDSSTFGHSVGFEQCYSAQLVTQLAAQGVRAEVLDGGVVGFSIRQAIERYRELVSPHKPDIVIGAFGSVIEHVGALGLDDDGAIAKALLEDSWWINEARRLRRDLRALHLVAWCVDELRGGRVKLEAEKHRREMLQTDLRTPMGQVDWKGRRRVSLEQYDQDICTLRKLVEADGARLILLSLPRRGVYEIASPVVLEYTKKLFEVGQREGIEVVDGRVAFAQAVREGHAIPELMADNFHPAALGHECLARALCAAILAKR